MGGTIITVQYLENRLQLHCLKYAEVGLGHVGKMIRIASISVSIFQKYINDENIKQRRLHFTAEFINQSKVTM